MAWDPDKTDWDTFGLARDYSFDYVAKNVIFGRVTILNGL